MLSRVLEIHIKYIYKRKEKKIWSFVESFHASSITWLSKNWRFSHLCVSLYKQGNALHKGLWPRSNKIQRVALCFSWARDTTKELVPRVDMGSRPTNIYPENSEGKSSFGKYKLSHGRKNMRQFHFAVCCSNFLLASNIHEKAKQREVLQSITCSSWASCFFFFVFDTSKQGYFDRRAIVRKY